MTKTQSIILIIVLGVSLLYVGCDEKQDKKVPNSNPSPQRGQVL